MSLNRDIPVGKCSTVRRLYTDNGNRALESTITRTAITQTGLNMLLDRDLHITEHLVLYTCTYIHYLYLENKCELHSSIVH